MKKRLDVLVAEQEGISREKAQALIMAGEVLVEGVPATKAGQTIEEDAEIEVKEKFPYVSRGALKLEKAAQDFAIDFKDKIVADIGASTGGFTDFTLQNGATKVFAIDTGKGQIAQKLRDDARVVLFENTNIKDVKDLPEKVDFYVVDVSFISLTKVLPALKSIDPSAKIIALIKPQFEVGKEIADKTKGVIRDPEIQMAVVKKIGEFAETLGYQAEALTESPIEGAKGNKEFLIYLVPAIC
jgi:23S rRNA (cytidine1920-2'-O)/16S rRNA (cytidine1409-2'-O)-methyltransferase